MRATDSEFPTSLESFDSLPDSALIRLPALRSVLSVSAGTVWRLSRAGKLKPVKVSERCTCWRVGDVRAYLDSLTDLAA
jgi:predicted DNA-binding transcriptional regulator AlpA